MQNAGMWDLHTSMCEVAAPYISVGSHAFMIPESEL